MIPGNTRIDVHCGHFLVRPSLADLAKCKQIGGQWDRRLNAWLFPATPETALILSGAFKAARTTPEFDGVSAGSDEAAACNSGEAIIAATPEVLPAEPAAVAARTQEPRIVKPAGIKTEPWGHQIAAINFCQDRFAKGRRGILLAMGMGCIDGDADLIIDRRGCASRITLREFCRKFHGGEGRRRAWKDFPTFTRSLIGGELRWNQVLDVISQGVMPVMRVTLASGKSLRVTSDHEFARPNETWTEAGNLAAGDVVLTAGTPAEGPAIADVGYVRQFIPTADTVISVEPDGETDVYDIRMADPGHNFVANGIIVHNCGKTLTTLILLLLLNARRVIIICPLRVVQVWVTEIAAHVGIDLIAVALDEGVGSTSEKLELVRQKLTLAETLGVPFICAVNYDSVWRDPLAAWLERQRWDVAVADECVPAGTLISTPHGAAPIEDLKAGDQVIGVDREGNVVCSDVTATFRRVTSEPLVQVEAVRTTPNHPVWVQGRGYVDAIDVKPGDWIRCYQDHHDHLRMVRQACSGREERRVPGCTGGLPASGAGHLVFNLETSTRNYFANGVLVHNCHRAKSVSGRASLFLKRFRRAAAYRLGLTGTPMPHGPMDIYAQFRFLDITVFGPSFTAFRAKYAVMGGYQRKEIVGYQFLSELEALMGEITFRVGPEVLDLPPATHVTYYCDLCPEARRIYRDLEKDFVADVEGGLVVANNALTRLNALRRIANGIAKTENGIEHRIDDSKTRLLADVLEDIGKDEPVEVFCYYHLDLDAVHDACRKAGFSSLELSGRRDELKQWQEGAAQVLAVQLQAGGVGINLVRARYSIYFSLSFSLGDYDQSQKRIHRPGQTRPVEYIHLVARNTVDVKIMRALERRAQIVESILAEIKNTAS